MRRLRTVRVVASAERGAALVMALLVLVILTAFGLTLVGLGMTEVSISSNWRDYTKDFYAAEAGLESGAVGLRNLLATTPQPTQDDLNGIVAPTLNTAGTTYNTYSITPVIPFPNNTYTSTFATGPYTGLFGSVSAYTLRAQVNGQGGTKADLTQVFQYTQVPLFQFGIFYGQGVDLEFDVGPAMTVNGRVHANSDMYVATSSTLQFQSKVTTNGNIYRRGKAYAAIPYKMNPQIADDQGILRTLDFDHAYKPGFTQTWASATEWANQVKSTFGSQVQDSAMGVGQITPPVPDLFNNPSNPDAVAHRMIEMPQGSDSPGLTAAKLYSKAGLRIIDGVATDQNGSSVSLVPGTITTTSFFDPREQKTVNVTQVDVSILNQNVLGNGVVYVASTATPTSTSMPAVRLVNGSTLPPTGLTVVSQNPVYIQGNYNTTTNGGGGNHPAGAVLADAITVLSNNWAANNSDTKGLLTPDMRPATPTTVNAALAMGDSSESTPGVKNGGLNNLIRFVENWGGQEMTYKGSLISLWHSQQATSPFRCCLWNATADLTGATWLPQYMAPPKRTWGYDTLFNTTQPPGTPMGIIMSKGRFSQS